MRGGDHKVLKIEEGATIPASVKTLYAHYTPETVTYTMYYQGWKGMAGALKSTREVGTPFGVKTGDTTWNYGGTKYTLTGWYKTDGSETAVEKVAEQGDGRLGFYDTLNESANLYTHWSGTRSSNYSEGGEKTVEINQSNYNKLGFTDVTKITLKDGDPGKGGVLSGTLSLPHGYITKIADVSLTGGEGVTELTWTLTTSGGSSSQEKVVSTSLSGDQKLENEFVTVVPRHTYKDKNGRWDQTYDKLSVIIDPTKAKEQGVSTLTVTSANGESATLTVDTSGHLLDRVEVLNWGSCSKPKTIRHHCVYSGCDYYEDTESYAKHTWAWRDVPATCTGEHYWQLYCKVCNHDATDEEARAIGENRGSKWRQGGPLGHNLVETTNTVVNACSAVTTKTCTRCGYTTTETDDTKHTWSSTYTVDVRPTCESEGSKSIKCEVCGVIKPGSSEELPIESTQHTWGAQKIDEKPATDNCSGSYYLQCTTCDAKEQFITPPTGQGMEPSKIVEQKVTTSNPTGWVDGSNTGSVLKSTIKSILESENGGQLADSINMASISDNKINAKVEVTPVENPMSEDASKFDGLISKDAKTTYMDIDILVTAGAVHLGKITETNGDLTFKVPLPADAAGKTVQVLRAHDGKVESISCQVEDNYVKFSSNKFSTYAVSVSDTAGSSTVTPNTGTNNNGNNGGSTSTPTPSTPSTPTPSTPSGSTSTPGQSGGATNTQPSSGTSDQVTENPSTGDATNDAKPTDPSNNPTDNQAKEVYRLYNEWSGAHLITASEEEKDHLVERGWTSEGVIGTASGTGESVYRLFNKWSDEHFFTTNLGEYKFLQEHGWTGEGEAFKTGGTSPVFRLYNPYVKNAPNHLYTTNQGEYENCQDQGWNGENIGWYFE